MTLREELKRIDWLKNVVRKIRKIKNANRDINFYKTLIVNFKAFEFKDAIKFPIFVYGKLTILHLSGDIIVDAPIRKGMIKLGYNTDCFSASKGSAFLNITGQLIFKGICQCSVDYTFDISGKCIIGELCAFGNGVKIKCWDTITIGKSNRIGVESQIFDTNFHFTRNIETGHIFPRSAPIVIGDFCWIGNRTTIMKGTHIPDYTIAAGNSLLNKNYCKEAPVAPTLAGCPAKIITSGNVRVFGGSEEGSIADYFSQNPDAKYYLGDIGLIDEIDAVKVDFY